MKRDRDQDRRARAAPRRLHPVGRTPDFNALCVGDTNKNGFYGRGIVNALGAVS